MNRPRPKPVPAGVVTETPTRPAACAGVVAVMVVALTTEKLAAAVPPKLTAVAPVNSVPVIVTTEPPVMEPVFGETVVIVGAAWADVASRRRTQTSKGNNAARLTRVAIFLKNRPAEKQDELKRDGHRLALYGIKHPPGAKPGQSDAIQNDSTFSSDSKASAICLLLLARFGCFSCPCAFLAIQNK